MRAVGRVAWRLEIETDHGIPELPFVVAANHHSFLDAVLIGAVLGQKIRFLALQDLFGHYRWVDRTLKAVDVIPLQRGIVPVGPVRIALSHLRGGGAVGLFPEGTRHRDFDPSRARHGAAWLATRARVPLVPVALTGTERILGVDNRLRRGRVRLTVGSPLQSRGEDWSAIEDLTFRWASRVQDALHAAK